MKNRKIIVSILLVAVLALSVVLSACDLLIPGGNNNGNTTHNFSDKWSSDATHHWHECTDKDCKETSGKAAHIFNPWIVDEYSTTTKQGSRHRECRVCHYVDTDKLPLLDDKHEHSFDFGFKPYNETHHYAVCSCGVTDPDNVYPHDMSDWVVEKPATTTETGLKRQTCTLCGYEDTAIIPVVSAGPRTVEFYAINDFHGTWERMAQFSGYLSQQKAKGNTVLINSGDMFQGSMESNSNYGALLAACMDDTNFDAFTYGNHEFDWGLDNLKQLASNSETPYLGANIYNWDRNTGWGEFASDLAKEYVIKEMDNGLKVGIIGVIGKDQITSISSQLVQTIGFKDPKEVVPALSEKLRGELGCDLVIVSAHTNQDTFLKDSTWDITEYADAVFCAHTHQDETTTKNGVPFIQAKAYGQQASYVSLTVDGNGNVACDDYTNIYYSLDWPNKFTVQEKIDNSNESIKEEANKVLGTLEGGYLTSATGVPRLVAHAIAEYAKSQKYDIELAMVNNARNSLQAGDITYTKLYEAIPFDNVVYIAKVSGRDILNEAKYDSNLIWRVTGTKIENLSNKYYTIAVIDYLLYHQNSDRNYNYFPSAFTSGFDPVPLTKSGVDAYNYRLITRDFLLKNGSVNYSTYSFNNDHTNKSLLEDTISLSLAGNATTLVFNTEPNFTYMY